MTDTRPRESLPAPAVEILEKAGRLTPQELEDLGRAWAEPGSDPQRSAWNEALEAARASELLDELAVWDKVADDFGAGRAAGAIADAVLAHLVRDRISDDAFTTLCQPWGTVTRTTTPAGEPIVDSLLEHGWPRLAGRTAQLILTGRRFPVTEEEIQALRDHGLLPKHVRVFRDGHEQWVERND